MDIQDWSVTAASNTDIDGTNIDEGCDPANVNNAIRAVMANIAGLRDLVGGAKTSGGTANAQTLTTGLSLSAYQQGLPFAFEAGATNTGALAFGGKLALWLAAVAILAGIGALLWRNRASLAGAFGRNVGRAAR